MKAEYIVLSVTVGSEAKLEVEQLQCAAMQTCSGIYTYRIFVSTVVFYVLFLVSTIQYGTQRLHGGETTCRL